MNEKEKKQIAEAIMAALGTKEASGVPAGPYVHGPGGLFSLVPDENPVMSAMVQPRGLLSVLPLLRSDQHVIEDLTTLTGVTAGEGSNPDGICDTPPKPGLKKLCTLAVPFGRMSLQTREVGVLRLGKLRDALENIDIDFPMNLMTSDNFFPMGGVSTVGTDVARREWANRLFELAVEFQRRLCGLVYTATPANNTANNGYMESVGMDIWINENNKRDKTSSAICRALNSDIKDFNYNLVTGTNPDIVQYLTMLVRYLEWNARSMGFGETKWVISMTPDLFYALCDIWPCRYLTDQCSNSAGTNVVVVNDELNQTRRNEMRNGSFLWINGERWPVVQDDCVPESNWNDDAQHHAPGEYSSDIYVIPLTVMGGRRVTGFQYFDQNYTLAQNTEARNTRLWTSDNGLFLWGADASYVLCETVQATLEWRLLMQTPQLAGRITNVKYAPLQHLRQHDPSDLYFLNGGVTERPNPTFYSMWSETPVHHDF